MKFSDFKKMRLSNRWKDNMVTVWLDEEMESCPTNHIIVRPSEKIDLRVFLGMSVYIHTQSYSAKLAAMYQELQKHASFILVGVIDFGDDLGWKWSREYGEGMV